MESSISITAESIPHSACPLDQFTYSITAAHSVPPSRERQPPTQTSSSTLTFINAESSHQRFAREIMQKPKLEFTFNKFFFKFVPKAFVRTEKHSQNSEDPMRIWWLFSKVQQKLWSVCPFVHLSACLL